MKLKCPQCGRLFIIPAKDVWWLADAKKRNPKLIIICSRCGYLEWLKSEKIRLKIK
jgi:ribosomal protein S27AE